MTETPKVDPEWLREQAQPDLRVDLKPFSHPWLKGWEKDPECGHLWSAHHWIDLGMPQYDHIPEPGLTVCPGRL